MKYAVLNESRDKVENVVESFMPLENTWVPIPAGIPANIGDSYLGSNFFSPEGEMRVTYENHLACNRIKELECDNSLKSAQIEALSDMLDFYEECIAEMAMIVYA